MSDFKHGASGYRRHKCRCDQCRQGHSQEQARRRSARSGPPAGPVAVPATVVPVSATEPQERVAGRTEVRVVAEIETLWRVDAWNAECDSWEQQAVDSAQRLDSGPPASQVAPLTRLKNEALRELRRLLAPVRRVPGDHRPDWEIEADAFVAGLTPLGHPSLRDPEFRNDE